MGLFDKKYCDVCGEKIGLFGNRKLEDGNLCKDCAKKLSPWFNERRESTVEEIKAQLAYREENQQRAKTFNVTRIYGNNSKKLYVDANARCFLIAYSNWEDDNPDIVDFSQVTRCEMDVIQRREEEKRKDADGNMVSYVPARYIYHFDFDIDIEVNSPWFDKMSFRLNDTSVEVLSRSIVISESSYRTREYMQYEELADEIKELLFSRAEAPAANQAAVQEVETAAPLSTGTVTCPWCGSVTSLDENGACVLCGGGYQQ